MSSNSFAATIDLSLRPSHRAHHLLFLLHAAPLALLPFAMAPGWPVALLIAAFAASWLWLRRHAAFGFGERALVRLMWHGDGHWTVSDAAGRKSEAELLEHSCVHARLMVLNFRLATGERRTRVVLGDELGADPLRRLRARMAVAVCAG